MRCTIYIFRCIRNIVQWMDTTRDLRRQTFPETPHKIKLLLSSRRRQRPLQRAPHLIYLNFAPQEWHSNLLIWSTADAPFQDVLFCVQISH